MQEKNKKICNSVTKNKTHCIFLLKNITLNSNIKDGEINLRLKKVNP